MSELQELSKLLEQKKRVDTEIAKLIGRPAIPGHIGEFIASKIFNIRLENRANQKGIDGIFTDGELRGTTVNIKIYGKQQGLLDITVDNLADYYLVLTGPKSNAISSKGELRPLLITHVYLFNMQTLMGKLKKRGIQIGVATSVSSENWQTAELYPTSTNKEIVLNTQQLNLLKNFSLKED